MSRVDELREQYRTLTKQQTSTTPKTSDKSVEALRAQYRNLTQPKQQTQPVAQQPVQPKNNGILSSAGLSGLKAMDNRPAETIPVKKQSIAEQSRNHINSLTPIQQASTYATSRPVVANNQKKAELKKQIDELNKNNNRTFSINDFTLDTNFAEQQRHINELAEEVARKKEIAENSKGLKENERYVREYNEKLAELNKATNDYNNALKYDKEQGNMASDIAKSLDTNTKGGMANIMSGWSRTGSRLSGYDATTIDANALYNYMKPQEESDNPYALLGNALREGASYYGTRIMPGGAALNEALGGGAETPTVAFGRLEDLHKMYPNNLELTNLYNAIASKQYNGTAEDLKKALNDVQLSLDRQFQNQYFQDEYDAVQNQAIRNENKYGGAAWIPNAFGTVGNMIPSILMGYAAGGIGELAGGGSMALAGSAANKAQQLGSLGNLGMGAANQGTNQAIAEGADYNQALQYGALTGLTEAGTEMLGGEAVNAAFGQVGKSVLGKLVGKGIDKLGIKSKVGKVVAGLASDIAGEATEEMISEALNPLWKAATYDADALPKNSEELGQYFKDIFNAGLEAIPSTLLMAGGGNIVRVGKVNQIENGIIKSIQESDLSPIVKTQLENEVRRSSTDVKLGLEEADTIQSAVNTRASELAQQSAKIAARIPEGYSLPQSTIDILSYTENNRPGLNIAFDTNIQGNGTFVENPDGTRTITLNPNSKRAVEFTLTHELGHDLKGTGEYTQLQNLLTDYAKGKPGYQEALKSLDQTYRESGANYNLQDEATNDMLGQAIGEQEFYNKLAENPTLFNRVTQGLKNLLGNKESKLKNKIEKLTRNAYQSAYKGTESNQVQNSLSENDKTLAATHNLTEKKLRGILELGGFPVPSIAISDVNKLTPTDFGDITVLFDKETINPENKENEVYDRDVWSPTFPQVDYEIMDDNIEPVAEKLGIKSWELRDFAEEANDADELVRRLIRNHTGDTIVDNYIKDNNLKYETVYREPDIRWMNKENSIQNFVKKNQISVEKLFSNKNLRNQYFEKLKQEFNKSQVEIDEINKYIDTLKGEFQVVDEHGDELADRRLLNVLQRDFNAINEGKEIDTYETNKNKMKAVEDAGINEYIKKIIEPVYGDKYIRNDKELFLPSGNRRSFGQLHDEYNLNNIVKAMTKQRTVGGESGVFGGFGKINANMSHKFNSINEIRANKGSLIADENNENIETYKENISNDIDELAEFYKYPEGFNTGFDQAQDAILDLAKSGKFNISNFDKLLEENVIDSSKVPDELKKKIFDDLNKLKTLKTDYFEAKPQRAVGFEEIASVLIPSDLAEDTKQQLRDRGIKYTEYDRNVEGDREAKYRQAAQDVLFSKSNGQWQQFVQDNFNLTNGTRTNFLPTNEELQQQERNSVAEDAKALNMEQKKPNGTRKKRLTQQERDASIQAEIENRVVEAVGNNFDKEILLKRLQEASQEADKKSNIKAKTQADEDSIITNRRIRTILDDFIHDIKQGKDIRQNQVYMAFSDPDYEVQEGNIYVETNKEDDGALFSLSEKQQQEVLDYARNIENDNTLSADFASDIYQRLSNVQNYSEFENIKQEVQDYKDKMYKGISGLEDIANLKPEDVRQNEMTYKQQKDKNTANQRKFFENVETSPVIAEETKNRVNATTYEQKHNLDTLEEVRQKLDERGNDLVEEWKHKSKNFTAKDVALGAILVERYQQNGDWNSAARAVEKLADMGTEAGRAVQMYSIFQRLSPETMAIYQQKALNQAFEDMKKTKTGKWVEANKDKFKLTADETQFIYNQVEKASQAIDDETKQRELSRIETMINNKLPPEKGQTIKALRRIAMLFNPKTQVRNIVGNTLIMPVNDAADIVGAAVDRFISRRTGVRTTSLPNISNKVEGIGKGVRNAITDYKTKTRTAATGSKYEFEFGAKPFNENTKSKALNTLNKGLNFTNDLLSAIMSGGDRPFYEAAYKNSLEGQMRANKVTEATDEMKQIAMEEGLQRTWNDDNEYTKFVLGIRKGMNKLNIHGFGLGDLIIPFAKTPANLTKAMVEYSPVGFLPAIGNYVEMNKAISRGELTPMQQKKFVSSFSKAIAGTVLYAIADALAKTGATTGSGDDDPDVRNFEQNVLGIQPYSIRLGDKTYTYSWANPINAPLAIMADRQKLMKENANMYDQLKSYFKVAGNTLLENSFLQGISDIFNNQDGVVQGLEDSITSMPSSLIPTFISQIASLNDDTQRQTYEYKNKGQTELNKIKNKIPGLRNTLEPSVNAYGEEIENQNNFFNAFFNPANVREARISESQKALYDLYQETKDKTILPDVAPSYTNTADGEKMNLTSKDKVTFSKTYGNYVGDVYEDLFKQEDAFTDNFQTSSNNNEGKIKILKEVKEDAKLKGREAIGAINADNNKDLRKLNERNEKLEKAGIPLDTYYLMWYAVNNGEDKKKQSKMNAIAEVRRNLDQDISEEQKKVLYEIFNITK